MSTESRQHAIRRIRARRQFAVHAAFYLALSVYLVAQWARSDAPDFWPVWALVGGGIGLAAHGSHLFGWQLPITEERIQREISRGV